jgi:putative toxin-antitoxin system antitoxin component (TIGR02293 family)
MVTVSQAPRPKAQTPRRRAPNAQQKAALLAKRAQVAAERRARVVPEMNYKRIFLAGPLERIKMVKEGLPAAQAKQIIADLDMPINVAGGLVHVPVSTFNRKVKNAEVLAPDVSERFLGLARLIGQVQTMVEESGDPEGFSAKVWTARWLNEPLPAFGGVAPIELMDTMEGQALVSATLARMQSGAYA